MKNTYLYKTLRRIKRIIQTARNRDCFFKKDLTISSTHFGSDYGGWRIPKNNFSADGIVYSAGIGTDISFDLGLISHYGIEVHAFDPTPKSIEWLETQKLPSKFRYYPWGLADYNGEAQFYVPKNPDHVSHSMIGSQVTAEEAVTVQVRKIRDIMTELGHTHLDLLKMDIEGAEYTVLPTLLSSSLRPTLLLVEFHHRFKSIGAKKTKEAVSALRKEGYSLYFISPSGEELCFIHQSALPFDD
jgi:FkbM family methyltransferase